MIWFRLTGYSDFQNRIEFETACKNPNHNFWFWRENKIRGNWKIRAKKRLRCEMWVEKNSRLSSGYECCCCWWWCCVRTLCSTAVMRRLSIDAMCVEHAVRCACGAVTHPRAQSTITFFAGRSRLHQKQNISRSTRACCSSPQNTRRCHRRCICTLPRLHRMTCQPSVASRWHGQCHAFGEVRVVAWCGANHLPCNARTYVR